ncbi:hypothetical protein J2Z69_001262 [Paenibacillus shirakamiensis]|uniref:Beta-xylosidase n=1 Tax=Paenibacillus shirakamiensis TaxID=1265935 RepID=A0ABS4JEX1_9BACL|nr:family 43 glycosylhydrolase [Paenibacillus shirakamiensis]MBP2000243.1 hypothetical protein [Paenibacillus shirakamiensis]
MNYALKSMKLWWLSLLILLIIGSSYGFTPDAMAGGQDIVNANQWRDTAGNPIQAHAGGALKVGEYYYWYGVERNDDPGKTFKQINMYKSSDLKNWTFVHSLITQNSHPDLISSKIERPKVIYNAATGKYIMWMHYENGADYSLAESAVAESSTIDGDYTFLGHARPQVGGISYESRDCTAFVDDNGVAYFISSSNGNANLNLYRLAPDYKSIQSLQASLFSGQYREAPALIKRNGYYYLLTSGATGWNYNQAKYAYSSSLSTGWSALLSIGSPSTYEGQGNYILPVIGTSGTDYLYMTDRHAGAFGEPFNNGKYVWHKIQFVSDTSLKLDWFPKLTVDTSLGLITKVNQNGGTGLAFKKDFGPDPTYLSISYPEEYSYMSDIKSVESVWEKIAVDETYFILKHKRTGRILHSNLATTNKLDLVDSSVSGPDVQWKLENAGGGYSKIVQRSSGYVMTSYPYGANLSLQPPSNSSNTTKWLLVNE